MNVNTKISLTVYMEGIATKSSEIEKIPYVIKTKIKSSKDSDKDGDKKYFLKKGFRDHIPLKPTQISRHLNISEDSYDFMISKQCPHWFMYKGRWYNMTTKQRLETHLQRTCEYLGGHSFTYKVIE